MRLRCKQIRSVATPTGLKWGSDIELGKGAEKRVYEFRPADPKDPTRNHVCTFDVANPRAQGDLATLLAITDGFEIDVTALPATVPPAAVAPAAPPSKPAEPPQAAAAPPVASQALDVTKLDRKGLLDAVEALTGTRPHPSTPSKKLIAQLQK